MQCYNVFFFQAHTHFVQSYEITGIKLQIASRTFTRRLLRPPVAAVLIRTHIVQSHFLFGPSSLRLEKYSFSVVAFRAWVFLGSRQCRVGYHVGDDVRQFAKRKISTLEYVYNVGLDRT